MSDEEHIQPAPRDPGIHLARGDAIGRYVVLDLVGRGGMGDVYATYDPELNRKVAVKVLRPRSRAAGTGWERRTRLLREAQAIARLSHPNVVVIFDVGTFRDTVFLAMEFLDGDTLGRWRQAGAPGWKEVLRVFLAAGRGLAAAHGAGLVHRDFKPDNVMVGRDGKVRVMDFGLARQKTTELSGGDRAQTPPPTSPGAIATTTPSTTQTPVAPATPTHPGLHGPAVALDLDVTRILLPPRGGEPSLVIDQADGRTPTGLRAFQANLTQSGSMLGTPAYMAPEQFATKPGDERSDQFSYCVALYEALYGVRPFAGKSLTALVNNVTAGRVQEAPAGSAVPPWIRKILLRGLSAAPENRYPSMDQLLLWLEKDPRVARRRWTMRAGVALLAIGAAFLTTVLITRGLEQRRAPCQGGGAKLAGIWEPADLPSPRKEAMRAAFDASGKSYARRAFDNASQILDRYVTSWTAVYAEACQATAVLGEQSAEVLDLRMSCLAGRLESVRALTDLFLRADAQVVEKATSAAEALAPLERCSDLVILRAVVKPPEEPAVRAHVQQLRRRLAEVKALGDAGRISDAIARGQPLVAEARALGYLPLTAEALVRLGWLTLSRPADAEPIISEGAWAASASGDDELFAEAAIAQVLNIGFQESRPEDARPWIRIADATLNRIGGHDLLRAWLINNQGAVLFAQGRNEEALEMFRRAVALKEKLLGPHAPDVASTLSNMGDPLAHLGRFEEALAVNQRALRIMEENDDQSDIPVCVSSRGEYLNALGRFAEAETQARRAIEMWERNVGTENAYFGFALTVLGRSYLGRERWREAVVSLTRAYDLRRRLDPGPSRVGETAFALAQALWRNPRDRPRALELASEAERQYAKTPDVRVLAEVRLWVQRHRQALGVIAW